MFQSRNLTTDLTSLIILSNYFILDFYDKVSVYYVNYLERFGSTDFYPMPLEWNIHYSDTII